MDGNRRRSEPVKPAVSRRELRRRISIALAPFMFFMGLIFLAVLAALIVIWVDMPRMAEEGAGSAVQVVGNPYDFQLENAAFAWSEIGITLLALLWPLFLAEFVLLYVLRDSDEPFWSVRYFSAFICLCPPLRMCARNPDHDDMIWLPGAGWREVDEVLRDQLERIFAIPMIGIALLILPVLGLEFGLRDQVLRHTWLRIALHVGTGLIWFAFAAEFILMFSVADKKLRYCRDHWIDLAIIILPLLSFLRSLRAVRALKVARFAKLQQLSRMGRLYRLRGLTMRAFRAILLLELLDRFIRVDPEKRLARLTEQLEEKEREAEQLREVISRVKREVELKQATLRAIDSSDRSPRSAETSATDAETSAADAETPATNAETPAAKADRDVGDRDGEGAVDGPAARRHSDGYATAARDKEA